MQWGHVMVPLDIISTQWMLANIISANLPNEFDPRFAENDDNNDNDNNNIFLWNGDESIWFP